MDDRTSLPGIKPAGMRARKYAGHMTGWILVRAKEGADWWVVDDRIRALPGASNGEFKYASRMWTAVPPECVSRLHALLEYHPGRLQFRSL